MTNLRSKQILVAVTILCLLMLSTGNLWGVIETSEARYAEIGREMYRSGDWLHPKLLSIYHYHKPPVTYWLTAAAFSLFGVNPFAARFFLVLSYGIQVFLLYRIARLLFQNEVAASYSALVYATLPLVLISARGLTTDSYLTTFILLSLYCGLRFVESNKALFLYGMAVALGLGFLAKGPVIFIVPMLAMAPAWRQFALRSKHIAVALLLFIVVGFSWFAFLLSEDPRFAEYFFFRHFVDRLAHAEVFARKEPWYYYLPIIPAVTLPWIVFFIGSALHKGTGDVPGKIKHVLIWWLALPLSFYSISSSKLVLYILPLSIGFSLVTGYFLYVGISKKSFVVFSALIALIILSLIAVPIFDSRIPLDITLIVGSSLALLVSIAIWYLSKSRELTVICLSTLFAVTLIFYSSRFFHLNATEVNSLTNVTSYIKQHGLRDRSIVIYDELLPSIAFELDKDIISVYDGDHSLKRETQFEQDDEWKKGLIDVTDETSLLQLKSILKNKSVVIVKTEVPPKLDSLLTGTWVHKDFGKWKVYHN